LQESQSSDQHGVAALSSTTGGSGPGGWVWDGTPGQPWTTGATTEYMQVQRGLELEQGSPLWKPPLQRQWLLAISVNPFSVLTAQAIAARAQSLDTWEGEAAARAGVGGEAAQRRLAGPKSWLGALPFLSQARRSHVLPQM
jgi:hypothetical protein